MINVNDKGSFWIGWEVDPIYMQLYEFIEFVIRDAHWSLNKETCGWNQHSLIYSLSNIDFATICCIHVVVCIPVRCFEKGPQTQMTAQGAQRWVCCRGLCFSPWPHCVWLRSGSFRHRCGNRLCKQRKSPCTANWTYFYYCTVMYFCLYTHFCQNSYLKHIGDSISPD